MNIADTSNYTIRVSNDVYYINNNTTGNLEYSLYKENQSLSLIYTETLTSLQEAQIMFSGDGVYKVYIGDDIVELRYYLQLQQSLITSIGDFLCDCCNYSTPIDCSCSTPIDVKCVQFSAIPLMLLSYQHLVSPCLDSCCAGDYLYNASNEYEFIIRESYLGHIQEECIKGKSLYGTRGLRYITAFYYALFLEAELEERGSEDAKYTYLKFDYDRISQCIEDLGVSYNKLKEIMGLCDSNFTQIIEGIEDINTKVDNLTNTVNNISSAIGDIQGDITTISGDIHTIGDTVNTIENIVENCCDGGSTVLYPPVANAGLDRSISVSETTLLDGTASYDSDGVIVSYLWTLVSSPIIVTIATPTTATTNITGFTEEGIYTFLLTVTDNSGLTDTDTVIITVGSAVPVAINSLVVNNRAADCARAYGSFKAADFYDSGSPVESVRIDNITMITSGTLTYNSIPITTPLTIEIADIDLLVYTADSLITDSYEEFFTFSVKIVENANFSNSATMTVINTSCAEAIAQIQLLSFSDVNINCGTIITLPLVPVTATTALYRFYIRNTGDLALIGSIVVTGADASRFVPDSTSINIASGGADKLVTVLINLAGRGGTTLNAIFTMVTNSDVNPSCVLNLSQPVSVAATPPITLASSITIPRDSTCTDIFTFGSVNFPYTSGSPVGRTHIRIDSLPSTGLLTYNGLDLGVDIFTPFVISEANIGLLTYTPDGDSTGTSSVTFTVVSSNNNGSTWG